MGLKTTDLKIFHCYIGQDVSFILSQLLSVKFYLPLTCITTNSLLTTSTLFSIHFVIIFREIK